MKIIEKTKEFGTKHRKVIKGIEIAAVSTVCIGGAYLLGVRDANTRFGALCNKAAFGDEVRLTHRPTGDSYKMILEKVVEEVVEVAEC